MKKLLFIFIALFCTHTIYAATVELDPSVSCYRALPESPCKSATLACDDTTTCNLCQNRAPQETTSETPGITEVTEYVWRQGCDYTTCYCGLSDTKTYKCASGYYGTATSQSTGCTKCPTGATCPGGNNSTFICPSDTLKTQDACNACPQYAICNGGTTFKCKSDFTPDGNTCICKGYIVNGQCYTCPPNAKCEDGEIKCNKNYYLDNNSCLACPYNGLTNGNGKTSKTECYIPAGRIIKLTNGTGEFTSKCDAQ